MIVEGLAGHGLLGQHLALRETDRRRNATESEEGCLGIGSQKVSRERILSVAGLHPLA